MGPTVGRQPTYNLRRSLPIITSRALYSSREVFIVVYKTLYFKNSSDIYRFKAAVLTKFETCETVTFKPNTSKKCVSS